MDSEHVLHHSLKALPKDNDRQDSDEQLKCSSVLRDSMVTVRLSDVAELPLETELDHDPPRDDSSTYADHGESLIEDRFGIMLESDRGSVSSGESIAEEAAQSTLSTLALGSKRSGSFSSVVSAQVDWHELDKSEEQVPRDEGSDESTAFLLARLEQENNALAIDPKAAIVRTTRNRAKSRPPSIQYLQKLVNEPTRPSLRYSMIPDPPPMTELEFWAALVVDYPQTAQRLPTLTSKKIRCGVPPPLRGVVWISIAGARDQLLEEEFDKLCGESSPYENLIGKDIGRSFPSVEMFRDPTGEGQQMLGRVLKCFSLYDDKIGYCQGLGFVVGPLLMHMGDKEAFCVLVRLMEHYDLRSCFLPNLSGLHLRIYQFRYLLSQHLPILTTHLEKLQVEPLYVSQWFLSFFGVTCPLPMLLRIYDVILTEGASETLMRVALSLMRRNQSRILNCTEFEDIMQLLLSRSLWDTYACNADDLVNDFVGLTGLVTRESLESLEQQFRLAQNEDSGARITSVPDVQAAASRFLGRFWAGSNSFNKASLNGSSLGVAVSSRPTSFLRRTPSKQSMASTLNSIESAESHLSAASTNPTTISSSPSTEHVPMKPIHSRGQSIAPILGDTSKDKDLHRQIEDLLIALSDLQREQTLVTAELQREREEREEDRTLVQNLLGRVKNPASTAPIYDEHARNIQQTSSISEAVAEVEIASECFVELEKRFARLKRTSTTQSRQQLREDVKLWKHQYELEVTKSADLSCQLASLETENLRLLEQFREARGRMQEAHQDKQRLEKYVQDLKSRRSSASDTYTDESPNSPDMPEGRLAGLREFKLGRRGSFRSQTAPAPAFSKRGSSLGIHAVLATEDHKPASEDALLLELVGAKTAEAVAKQELEEVKGKLDSLRRLLGDPSPTITPTTCGGHRPSPSEPHLVTTSGFIAATSPRTGLMKIAPGDSLKVVLPSSATGGGGFFSGWGKRAVSTPPALTVAVPESS